jgi:hypothetical protein
LVTDQRSLAKSRKLGAELWLYLEKNVSGKYDNYVDKRRYRSVHRLKMNPCSIDVFF